MHFCGSHRYGATILNIIGNDIVQRKCFCKRETANRLYEFCRQIRYRLNFRCHKICLDKVPDFMLPRVKALSKYLREIDCDPFFHYKNNRIEISLDNPEMDKIVVETDHRPVLYRS